MSFILSLRPQELLRSIIMSTSVCVCVSVCLSARISPELHARSLRFFLCLLPMAEVQSPSGRVTNPKGKGQFWGIFFPIDNALYSIAFGTIQKLLN